MIDIVHEIYQLIFITAIIYLLFVFSDLTMKLYGRIKFKTDLRFQLTKIEKTLLIISLSIFLTYIIK